MVLYLFSLEDNVSLITECDIGSGQSMALEPHHHRG